MGPADFTLSVFQTSWCRFLNERDFLQVNQPESQTPSEATPFRAWKPGADHTRFAPPSNLCKDFEQSLSPAGSPEFLQFFRSEAPSERDLEPGFLPCPPQLSTQHEEQAWPAPAGAHSAICHVAVEHTLAVLAKGQGQGVGYRLKGGICENSSCIQGKIMLEKAVSGWGNLNGRKTNSRVKLGANSAKY